ncbi:MAG TPA: prepilin-type N-terminal cleavage/methylation domain-containing protein [Gemmataceae bacterium]|nr:prepilin-type N-terminal cleavage/methylation domain-containing protein [Gemmataceae bacterium]
MKHSRSGFTLVELLVAMAVTIFILMILAQAFALGTDLFRGMKAVGDLNASLRTATNMIRSDLSAKHFEGERRLSDSKFYDLPNNGPPQHGYFFLYLPPAGGDEPPDPDSLPSRRRVGHVIAGTARARGNRQQDYYTALDPAGKFANFGNPDARMQQPGTFSSQWIEFCYFLSPVQDFNNSAGGTPLFALYRQQRLVVADVDQLNWGAGKISTALQNAYADKVSCKPNPNAPGFLYFNSPADLTMLERRTAGTFPVGGAPVFTPLATGEDLLLTDVLSFDVQVLFSNNTPADTVQSQFRDLTAPAYRFDTWSQRVDDIKDYSALPNPFSIAPRRILALQITLRVWDAKSKTTRQITMIQDM